MSRRNSGYFVSHPVKLMRVKIGIFSPARQTFQCYIRWSDVILKSAGLATMVEAA